MINTNCCFRLRVNLRSTTVIFLCLLLAPFSVTLQAQTLSYSDASPSGAQFPEWDGGDTGLCFADIDTDGHIDLLSIGDHGSPYINTDQHGVMVYFGDGAGGWSIHMEGNFGYGGIAVSDVNNDGFLDVGYGMHHDYSSSDFGDQLIEVALGDGSGTAWTPWDDGLASSGESWGMFATDFADMDNDGDMDLASNSFGSGNGVHVYRNNGDGSWVQTWALTGGNARSQLCFGDVNGDGVPDIAAAYQYGTIFLGDGAGSFIPEDTGLPDGGSLGLGGVALGDVDDDGCADLSFTQGGGVLVYLWRIDHWESASTGLPGSGNYTISRLWDMNVDGLMDVAALGDGIFTVWLGDGTGAWAAGGGFENIPAVDTAALEVRGDVDHNGYPDAAYVQEEGSWPSYQNHLYVYRESSIAAERFAILHSPRGGEVFFAGSVQTIRWSAAHVGIGAAQITLELSTSGAGGPWTPLVTGIPDSGHYQWTVPGPASTQAHLRISLTQGPETVSDVSGAFRILSGQDTIGAALDASPLSGVLPFSTNFTAQLSNLTLESRRAAAHIDVDAAGGGHFTNWRSGWTNLAAGESFSRIWNQTIPAIGSLLGTNEFHLIAEDVTPSPWNQPPYPPAGDTDTATCTVTGLARTSHK